MRVAVTGAASDFATAILPRLFEDQGVEEVVGIDLREPRIDHSKLRFEREDVRSERMAELFAGCEAVVHLAFIVEEIPDKARIHDVNINGSRNVLTAAHSAGVERLVIASSDSAYGGHADLPKPVTEETFPRGNPGKYYFYDKAEVEHFVEWWERRHPDSGLTITRLRPGFIVGPDFSNEGVKQFTSPATVMPRGFAGGFQFVHQDDLADAFHRMITADHPGAFNVATEDWLDLDEVAGVHGQRVVEVPLGFASAAADVLYRARVSPVSSQWVVPGQPVTTSAKLRAETGWEPRFTSAEALQIMLVQHGRPILRPGGPVRRREVAETALAPVTELARAWCEQIPGVRDGTGGPEAFDTAIERAEHVFLPFRAGDIHAEVHSADADSAPSIVFSPGIGGHVRPYSPALAALCAEGFNVIGVDRPGHGLSTGPRGDAPVEVVLDVLEMWIAYARERFGGPVVLAGHSLGGITTWFALTREPDVDAAVCISAASHPQVLHEPAMRVKVPLLRRLARVAPRAPLPITQIANVDEANDDPQLRRFWSEELDKIWCWTLSARTMASFYEFTPMRDWTEVEIPVLVLAGERDLVTTAEFVRTAFDRATPPNAELRVLDDAGHGLLHEQLPTTLPQIAAFVREHAGAAAVPA